MNAPRRNRARVLTPDGLKQLRERVRSRENEENSGFKYTLEKLGELTGLDPETVKNVLDGNGSDKRTIARCFESFGLILADSDHMPAALAIAVQADPNFVGREGAIADLTALVSRKVNVIVIQARGGVGKTTLARKYLQQEFGSYLEFPIAKETKDIASIEGLIEEKLRQLGEEPGREFLVSLDRLKRKLQGDRIGILIDNLEPALDSTGKFIEAHRRYLEVLRVLNDPTVQSLTLITSRERLREPAITVHHYGLKSLDVKAWSQFFQSRNIQLTPLSSDGSEGALAALHHAYGGNAKAMDMISGAVLEDFSGNVDAYWQANQADLFIERDLEDLVAKQFARLQQLDPDAYNLLCRMGCYRYQDVPTVPIEGLFCLLWDIPANRHRRVIKSLQDRSLVDCENGEFWLHPVIRAEAISRLRVDERWKITNQQVAEFWTESVEVIRTFNDVLKASEAYYNYIDINDIDSACKTLVKERKSSWYSVRKGEPLGRSLYRFGLLHRTIHKIDLIIKIKIKINFDFARVNQILGEMYHILGNIYESRNCYEKAKLIVNQCLSSDPNYCDDVNSFKRLLLVCHVMTGVFKIDLWEIDEAIFHFEDEATREIIKSNDYFLDLDIDFCFLLAYLYSCHPSEKLKNQAREISDRLYREVDLIYLRAGTWQKGNFLLFLGATYCNLDEINKSFEIYQKAIEYASESHYEQVKAIALSGFARLYRIQGIFDLSVFHHLKSIEILNKLEAKIDLAQAYYQFGLTYQMMNKVEESRENFHAAIRLFNEMEAPKQVERVRRSMQS